MLAILTIIIGMALIAFGFASLLYLMVFSILQIYKTSIISKIKKIKSNGVVLITRFPNALNFKVDFFSDNFILLTDLYLHPFAIITKTHPQSDRYKLTIPYLKHNEYTQSVQLHYYSTIHCLDEYSLIKNFRVKSVIQRGDKNNYKLTTVQQLAPIINEHLQIKAEIKKLRKRYDKISKLAKLVAASDIYNERLHIYETALRKIINCSNQAEQLQQSYTRLVREMLIGIKVAEEELKYLPDRETSFDLQYLRIQEEYNFMKDEATAYYQLLKDSRYSQV